MKIFKVYVIFNYNCVRVSVSLLMKSTHIFSEAKAV